MDVGTPKRPAVPLPYNAPSPAYVLARDGSWALVWMPKKDQLLWVDLDRVPFEGLSSNDRDVST